ncbi:MAG: Flagellar biosynthesis protein FlhA [Pseudomonadota bacterium]
MATAATAKASTGAETAPTGLLSIIKSPDIQFAVGLLSIVFMMIVPLPAILLDMLLAVSITVSILILLVSVYIKQPLDFSTFPTVLLVTTLFRLGLNVATTRAILLKAQNGDVSDVVEAFGKFVVGGNYFVGFTIFVILVIINFIVITKGAGRVAEVGARFTLDAMPGKQMAIDAEMNAGLIDRDEAKRRRAKVEQEADFYGAMDGASKFVRGDAIAGIIITIINIIVGLMVGVFQHNMSFGNAAELYTLLTVGDGLVSQIPALIISTAAGIIVTRASAGGGLSQDLSEQMIVHPKALYACSGLLVVMALIPGLPALPFLLMAAGFYYLARQSAKAMTLKIEEEAKATAIERDRKDGASDSIEALLHVDTMALEVGVGLIPLVDTQQDGEILERIISARKQFAQDLGIVVPMVMVRDNIQLAPGEYQILLKGNVIGRGNLMIDYYLAMDPGDISDPIQGIKTIEPAYGLEAIWIKPNQRDEATFRGYTAVNCATVVVTHLTKLISEHAQELLGRQETQNLIDSVKKEHPKVVEEMIGADRLTLGDVVKVLQNLLGEGVSIRDALTIFETLADHSKSIKSPEVLTRYVRIALGRGIIKKYLTNDNQLLIASLDRAVEDTIVMSQHTNEDGSSTLDLDPEMAQRLLNSIAATMRNFEPHGAIPILLCGSRIRWGLRKLVNRFIPGLIVLAFDELPQGTKTKSVGTVRLQ